MLPRSLRAAAALSVVVSAAAQSGFVWGTSGSWQQIVPTPDASGNVAQPAVAYQHAAFVPGTLLLTGNTTAVTPGSMDLYKYNIVMNTWSAPFDFVPNPAVQIPFLFTYGGLAVIADEAQPNVMNMIDQSMPSGAWTKISVANAPLGRVAMRFVVWGSQLYFFGGVNLLNGNAKPPRGQHANAPAGSASTARTCAWCSGQMCAHANSVALPGRRRHTQQVLSSPPETSTSSESAASALTPPSCASRTLCAHSPESLKRAPPGTPESCDSADIRGRRLSEA